MSQRRLRPKRAIGDAGSSYLLSGVNNDRSRVTSVELSRTCEHDEDRQNGFELIIPPRIGWVTERCRPFGSGQTLQSFHRRSPRYCTVRNAARSFSTRRITDPTLCSIAKDLLARRDRPT